MVLKLVVSVCILAALAACVGTGGEPSPGFSGLYGGVSGGYSRSGN